MASGVSASAQVVVFENTDFSGIEIFNQYFTVQPGTSATVGDMVTLAPGPERTVTDFSFNAVMSGSGDLTLSFFEVGPGKTVGTRIATVPWGFDQALGLSLVR